MAHDPDVEITLGTGRLLGLFFALVVVCAVFFALGYSLGRSAAPPSRATAEERAANSDKSKAATTAAQPAETPQSSELTFYKAVKQNDAYPQLEATEPAPSRTPEGAKPLSGYVVQVAAVSKEEDAQALANALRRKNYEVVITGYAPLDKLYHVQLGPFAEIKDADAMRARLNADGYNPIVKK